ncbi:DDE superfamily endonuclease CENP-B-like protein [Macrophomina phaseolina MS6]|uniref:DDE superfamily endonuclease CENP-B-like protein n=1 Tax=Macrophomina phaseolina (strain MS6) TaxID=1126212 RepID=K2R931_MACPH|nr:DDE superfamily endonuclease CENP-B-like protein [Macrophomina phaseolina MS6]
MYLEELAWFILDEFDVLVSQSTISRALTRQGWSYKTARFVSNSRNYDARNQYLEQISAFASWQLVFVDESGVDTRNGRRKYGWSFLGVSPHAYSRLGRSERFPILPAYTQDGVIATATYKGSTDNARYEYWLEHSLLPRCNRYPRRHSVVVMDNAGFHHSERMKAIFERAGVKLIYLPTYSPDCNERASASKDPNTKEGENLSRGFP